MGRLPVWPTLAPKLDVFMIPVCDVVTKAAGLMAPRNLQRLLVVDRAPEGPPLTRVYAVWRFGAAKEGFSGLDIVLRNRAGAPLIRCMPLIYIDVFTDAGPELRLIANLPV